MLHSPFPVQIVTYYKTQIEVGWLYLPQTLQPAMCKVRDKYLQLKCPNLKYEGIFFFIQYLDSLCYSLVFYKLNFLLFHALRFDFLMFISMQWAQEVFPEVKLEQDFIF